MESDQGAVLIDAGLSCRELVRRLQEVGSSPEQIQALVVTHEHGDHLRGAGPFARRFRVPVYLNGPTLDRCAEALGTIPERVIFDTGDTLKFGALSHYEAGALETLLERLGAARA